MGTPYIFVINLSICNIHKSYLHQLLTSRKLAVDVRSRNALIVEAGCLVGVGLPLPIISKRKN